VKTTSIYFFYFNLLLIASFLSPNISVASNDSHQFEASILYSLSHQSNRIEYETTGGQIKAYFTDVPHNESPLGETQFLNPTSNIFFVALNYEGDFECPGACGGDYKEEIDGYSNAYGAEIVYNNWLFGVAYFDIESNYDEYYLGVNSRSESNTRTMLLLNLTSYTNNGSAISFLYGTGEDDLNCKFDLYNCGSRNYDVNLYEFVYKSVSINKKIDNYASSFKFNLKREQTDKTSLAEAGIYGDIYPSRTYSIGARIIHTAIDINGNTFGLNLKIFVTDSLFIDLDAESLKGDNIRDESTATVILGAQF